MAKLYSVLEINWDDLDDRGQYIGEVNLSDTDIAIEVAPALGLVVFPGPVKTSGSIKTGPGTSLKIRGNLTATRGVFIGSSLEVDGSISAALGIIAQGKLQADRYIRCGGDIQVGSDIVAGGYVSAFGSIKLGGSIYCPEGVTARIGSLTAGQKLIVDGLIKARDGISAARIQCRSSIEAGGEIRVDKSIHANRHIRAGKGIFADTVVSEQSIFAGGCIEVGYSLRAGLDIQAAYYIKALQLYAVGRIFAGLNGESPLEPGDDLVQGVIIGGLLAHGQHIAA